MEKLIYSKYSNERSRRFALRTDIIEKDGMRVVKKIPLSKEGEAHVANLSVWNRKLERLFEKASFVCNKCTLEGKSAVLQYVTGQTLEERLDDLIKAGDVEEAQALLVKYLRQIDEVYRGTEFVKTDDFIQIFGNRSIPEGMECGRITDVDMVCQNLILSEQPVVLDYEWTFDFPIPGKYVLYRTIHYYIHANVKREVLDEKGLYQMFDIEDSLLEEFGKMENSFQKYIIEGHIPMRDMFLEMSPGAVWLQREYEQTKRDYQQSQDENKELKAKIKDQSQVIHTMKNTKVWKLYRKYRKIVEGK